jgi:hypothetical protein
VNYSTLALFCFTVILISSPSEGAPIPTPADAYNRPNWLGQLPFQFAAPVFQVVPWIVNAVQAQYRNMELVAQLAEMQLANTTEPTMENYQRKKRFVSPTFWNLVKEQCKPQEHLHAPFIRDRTPEDSQEHLRQKRFVAPFVLGFIWSHLALQKGNRTAFVPENIRPQDFIPTSPENPLPRERRETRSIKPELAAQINRTAQILQALMNPGLGLPADRLLQQVEKDLNSTAQDVSPHQALDYILDQIKRTAQILQIFLNPGLGPRAVLNLTNGTFNGTFTTAQEYNLATRRSQNLSTFAMFSLIMAFLMAAILVAGICAQLGLKAEEDLEKTPLPIIKMTSIIDPEDITADVLPLVRTDPQGNGIIGETP